MRLVNDGAYAGLAAAGTHVTLASVAKDYPELEWLELYSVSKSYNDPGARLGALVGSKDFVEDFTLVKGNTDSGPVPGVMAAYGEFLSDPRGGAPALDEIRGLYEKRLAYLIPRLKAAGLKPACATEAGFFTLWHAPEVRLRKNAPAREAPRGVQPRRDLRDRDRRRPFLGIGERRPSRAADPLRRVRRRPR